ncbi:hypothetical protein AAFF_G00238090 [Aldrovandia affinis]|uniref:Protein S100 n=1 Tax=Aldrovandia affinis TaxID=143900 RepID=A0AAD7RE80_9TELE|nr:hypothetical protein AAFF_G00238090 [Aldrovandia affinis]
MREGRWRHAGNTLLCTGRRVLASMDNPTALEAALAVIVLSFKKHAAKGKDPKGLNQEELMNLLNTELPHLMQIPPEEKEKVFAMLDKDGNKSLDFAEFFGLVGALAHMCNCLFQEK